MNSLANVITVLEDALSDQSIVALPRIQAVASHVTAVNFLESTYYPGELLEEVGYTITTHEVPLPEFTNSTVKIVIQEQRSDTDNTLYRWVIYIDDRYPQPE